MPDWTGKQTAAVAEFCEYATSLNPEGSRIRPDDLIVHERLHNGDPKEDRLDLTVVALTPDIIVTATIDCYGNGYYCHGDINWIHNGADEDCTCDECESEARG
jgi:hypothetical protein